ncbi:hypothetical protein VP1G_01320 [Cytospora mali]|uniref:WD repeat-containing protein C2A9.03 n=1 Tax=Cytospora mali TaxID=578113 RepID=A0A194UQU6_CYTMA|nr:hypothetical protein VP1G_01320 [Valsa mali var. pyri (nom. inval.)]
MWSDHSDPPVTLSSFSSSSAAASSSSSSSHNAGRSSSAAAGDSSSSSNSTFPSSHGSTAQHDASKSTIMDFDTYNHTSYESGPSDYHHDPEHDLSPFQSTEQHLLDDYSSDDHDLEDGGVAVNYGDLTNILTQGMDMDYDSDPEDGLGFPHVGLSNASSPPPPLMNPLPHYGSVPGPLLPHHQAPSALFMTSISTTQPHQPESTPGQVQEPNNNTTPHLVTLLHHPAIVHGNILGNPNTAALGPENYNLADFLRVWAWQNGAWQGIARERGRYPWLDRITPQISKNITHIDYQDLEGDAFDVQGIDWEDLGVTRGEARERRLLTYKNYTNIRESDKWREHHDVLPCSESYFRFRRLDLRKNISLSHFQLRNVLASTSRSQVFYPGQMTVQQFNPISGKGKVALKAHDIPQLQVSTLAADHGTLVAGGFFGEYCFRRLDSDEEGGSGHIHEGTITTDSSGITNHVQVHLSRSSTGPKASFASNDRGFRVLDIETDKFISEVYFEQPVNCSAISPDCRLRVMVGDQKEVLITKAETDGQPEILQRLSGHGDFGFACDWADDGWTVATGFQDKLVKVWDARRWTNACGISTPVCTLRAEMAGVRALKFSPIGSGKRVLVAAEEADFVNIIDAQTFQAKQTFDFFGEIGGVSFANEGQDLHVLCCDRVRGGLFNLERCGVGAERNFDPDDARHRPYDRWMKNTSYDWHEFETTPRRIPRHSDTRRRRRALALDALDPF